MVIVVVTAIIVVVVAVVLILFLIVVVIILFQASILSSKRFLESLLDMFSSHVVRGTGALVISALLDFLTFALCAPYSETTHGDHFDSLLEMVASHGRAMFKLFQVSSRKLLLEGK